MTASRLLFIPAAAALVAANLLFWWLRDRPVEIVDAPGGKLGCTSYTPFREGQTPGDLSQIIPAWQIEEDLKLLSQRFDCVRTYAVNQGLDQVPAIARRYGLKVLLGAWIGHNGKQNRIEITTAAAVANAHKDVVRAIIVGNEVLLRGDLSEDNMIQLLKETRAATSVPVTYADVWELWRKHRRAAEYVDFVTIHILPYWEDEPIPLRNAVAHALSIWRRLGTEFGGKTVYIGEIGWPGAGRPREGALPGRVSQARFIREFAAAAKANGLEYNLIEAFDQPWKRRQEGTVGGNWGLYTADRRLKFPLTGPVGNEPRWQASFLAASALGLAALGLLAASGAGITLAGWLGLGLAAAAAGSTLVFHLGYVLESSRTHLDWALGAAGTAYAAAAAWVLLQAFAETPAGKGTLAEPPMPLRNVIEVCRHPFRATFTKQTLLGLAQFAGAFAAAAVTLELIFQARYRNFPLAGFLIPAVGFALAAIAGRRLGTQDHGRPEEACLAAVLLIGSVLVLVQEGIQNPEALAWAAAAILMAAPWVPALGPWMSALLRAPVRPAQR